MADFFLNFKGLPNCLLKDSKRIFSASTMKMSKFMGTINHIRHARSEFISKGVGVRNIARQRRKLTSFLQASSFLSWRIKFASMLVNTMNLPLCLTVVCNGLTLTPIYSEQSPCTWPRLSLRRKICSSMLMISLSLKKIICFTSRRYQVANTMQRNFRWCR